MKLTEGFDVPAVNCVVLARATKSKALSLQMIGRGLRLSPETEKVDCVVLDFVGNVKRFGFVEDLKEIRLTKGGEKEEGFPTPTKICPQNDGGCGAIINAFQMNCPCCGYHFEAKKLQIALKLKQRLRPEDFERIKFYRDKLKEAFFNKYSPVWAANRFRDSYGHFPPLDWAKKALFDVPTPSDQDSYRRHLQAIAQRSQKDTAWVEKYFNLEFSD
jgi:superfamily II DNA or RNA helicase